MQVLFLPIAAQEYRMRADIGFDCSVTNILAQACKAAKLGETVYTLIIK
jgi:hypothetical protein